MVYYIPIAQSLTEGDCTNLLNSALPLLPEYRLRIISKIKSSKNSFLSAYSFLLLKYALSIEYPEVLAELDTEFIYGDKGKPSFPYTSDIHFNISHCPLCICVGIDKHPIGIDCQDLRKINPSLKNKEGFANMSDKEFIMRWSILESIAKLKGTGIADPDFFILDTKTYRSANHIYTSSLALSDGECSISVASNQTEQVTFIPVTISDINCLL